MITDEDILGGLGNFKPQIKLSSVLPPVDRITPPRSSSFHFPRQLERIRLIMRDARDESQGWNFLFEHL